MYQDQIRHLEVQHRDLDNKIDTLEKTGIYEDLRLQELKKRRLQVRDQLNDLRRRQFEYDHERVNYDDYE
jgi:hypothetical protein